MFIIPVSTILIIFITVSIFVESIQSTSKFEERQWKSKQANCERKTCQNYVKDEGMNCVNECLSPKCFSEIYGEFPLEDGEIDTKRYREFLKCVRLESRNINLAKIREQKTARSNKS